MTLAAVLLVGGQSRRMGADKATLLVGGEALWSRQLRVLRELQPVQLMVSAREQPLWSPPNVEVVLDEMPSRGPLSGLTLALRSLRASHLLVLAVDMPAVTEVHLRKLWAEARAGEGVIPKTESGFEPLCAIYPAAAGPEALKSLTQVKCSLQSLAQNLVEKKLMRIYTPTEAECALYRNANTPADLK